MKKIYFAILIFLFAGKISAQTYSPLLDSSNTWSYTTHMYGVRLSSTTQSGPCSYPISAFGNSFRQYTSNDTTMNSFTYKIVLNDLMNCVMGYIREDTAARKVYFVDNIFSPEIVLYDFSMQVNDTITLQFQPNFGYVSGLYTLDSISNVTIYSGTRRAFYLNCHSSPFSYTVTWVESVGHLNDVLYPYFDNTIGAGLYNSCPGIQHQFYQFMICFDHQDKVYFDNCAYTETQNNPNISTFTDSCDYWSFAGALYENQITTGFEIFPNPSNGKSTINFEVKCENDFELFIWDIGGKMLMKQIPLGKLHEGKNRIEIDFADLKNGMYVVEMRSPENSFYSKVQVQN